MGPLQKRLSYFLSVIVGAQRFLMLTWTLAGAALRAVMQCWALLATPCQPGLLRQKRWVQRVGPLHSAPQRRLRLAYGWCKGQKSALKSSLVLMLVCYLTLAAAFWLSLFGVAYGLPETARQRTSVNLHLCASHANRRVPEHRGRDTTGELPTQLRAR